MKLNKTWIKLGNTTFVKVEALQVEAVEVIEKAAEQRLVVLLVVVDATEEEGARGAGVDGHRQARPRRRPRPRQLHRLPLPLAARRVVFWPQSKKKNIDDEATWPSFFTGIEKTGKKNRYRYQNENASFEELVGITRVVRFFEYFVKPRQMRNFWTFFGFPGLCGSRFFFFCQYQRPVLLVEWRKKKRGETRGDALSGARMKASVWTTPLSTSFFSLVLL